MCIHVFVRVRACLCAYVRARVCVCVRDGVFTPISTIFQSYHDGGQVYKLALLGKLGALEVAAWCLPLTLLIMNGF